MVHLLMMIILICLILPLFFLLARICQVYLNAHRIRKHFERERIAGPTWQSSPRLIQNVLHNKPIPKYGDELEKLIKRFSDEYHQQGFFQVWISSYKPWLVITDPSIVQAILNSTEHLDKADFYNMLRPLLQQSLFTSPKELWIQQKRHFQQYFKLPALKHYWQNFQRHVLLFNERIEKHAQQNHIRFDDFQPLVSAFVIDSLGENLFSCQFKAQTTEIEPKVFITAHNLSDYVLRAIVDPWVFSFVYNRIICMLYYMFTHYNLVTETVDCFRQITKFIIKRFREIQQLSQSDTNHQLNNHVSILDSELLGNIKEKRIQNFLKVHGNVAVFIITGYDTTMTSLTWLIYELHKHQDKQEKLRQEIDEFLLDLQVNNESITIFNIKRLKYLDSCLKESLRLHSIAYFIGRYARTDMKLDNGMTLPGNMDYIIPIQYIQLNHRYFRHANQFIPERFMVDDDQFTNHLDDDQLTNHSNQPPWFTKSAFIPFSDGPRMCIGKQYSLIAQKLFMINLLSKYRFKILTENVIEERSFLLKPAHYPIEFQLRNDNDSKQIN